MLIELLVFAFAVLVLLGFIVHPMIHILAGIAAVFLAFEGFVATGSVIVGSMLGILSVVMFLTAILREW